MGTLKATAAAAVLALALAACSGGDDSADSAYCQDIKAAQKSFGDATSGGSLDQALSAFHGLAEEAPSAVDSEWKTVDKAFTALEAAFDKAGVDLSDTAGVQEAVTSGDVPASAIQELTSTSVTKALTSIEKHAKSVCKVDISS